MSFIMGSNAEPSDSPKSDDAKADDAKTEIKDDPDALEITDTRTTGRRVPAPRMKVKDEPSEYVKIDLTLPDGEDDMFEDVDELDENGDEIVDLTYEGIAHVNGVRHFVCEGLSRYIVSAEMMLTFPRIQNSSNSRTFHRQTIVI